MTPEALLYTRIREALGPEWDTQRIENVIGRGCPDITTSNKRTGDVWIEAKAGDHAKPLIRPEQYAWMKRRAHMGGQCCIITQRKEDRLWFVWPIYDGVVFTSVGSYLIPKYPAHETTRLAGQLNDYYGNA